MNNFKLSKEQIKFLKEKSHILKPVVMIGSNGFTKGVLCEIINNIQHHELIKIKITGYDKDMKLNIINAILRDTEANLVQIIGNIVTIFKMSDKQKIKFPQSKIKSKK